MQKKLSWQEIKDKYPDQWVELIDFDWDDFESDPRSGVVLRNAKSRKEIHDDFMKDPIDDSAIVFTGAIQVRDGAVFSANLHQYPHHSTQNPAEIGTQTDRGGK